MADDLLFLNSELSHSDIPNDRWLSSQSMKRVGKYTTRAGYVNDDLLANFVTVVIECYVMRIPHFINKSRDYKRKRFTYKISKRGIQQKNARS